MAYIIYGVVGGLVLTFLAKMLVKNTWIAAVIGVVVANIILLAMGTFDNYFLIGSVVGGVAIALMPNKGKKVN